MAFTQMTFDKVWTNPIDFPTHETQETKVREDMQYLFDSIKNQFNNFLSNELTAENLFFAQTEDIQYSNVQDAIVYVFSQIQEAYSGSVPDGSVVTAKLHDGAVTTVKIDDSAVTTVKIADEAVTGSKIAPGSISGTSFADGSIPAGKLDINAVNTNNLVNNCVTAGKLANDSVIEARILNGAVTTVKIADGNVTEAKLASALAAKINGKLDKYTEATVTLESGATSWSKTNANITANSLIYASPKTDGADGDTNFTQWTNFGIRPNSQGAGTITFKSRSQTTADCVVNLAIFNK